MNAIQYFDWGGEGVKIHFCRIRAKNLFNTQEWRDIKSFFPFRVGYIGKIVYTTLDKDNINMQIGKPKVFIEGNDLVWDVFVRENINEMRTLKVINFQVVFNVIYLNGCSTYIADLSSAYRNCYNALKKGGSLILLDVPVESAYGILYSFAKYVEGYDEKLFSRITPALPYPIELVKSGIFHSPIEKLSIVKDELKMKNIRFMQTLVAHPIYTNDSVEEPIEGYDKGGYVALIAEK